MTCLMMHPAERAQLAMMLEVTAYPKPGNVDRCHDYPETRLEHFLASTIFARQALEEAGEGKGRIGEIIGHAVRDTNCHDGGNTHFGAFILHILDDFFLSKNDDFTRFRVKSGFDFLGIGGIHRPPVG